MPGRFAYFLIAGGAIVGGMVLQGDISVNPEHAIQVVQLGTADEPSTSRESDQAADAQAKDAIAGNRTTRRSERLVQREMSEAVAEYARAEGRLIAARIDNETPAPAIRQAEARRDAAKAALDRLADEAKAADHPDRDALRREIRESVRAAVRS